MSVTVAARQSNIELLRILAMTMIVMWHFMLKGGLLATEPLWWCATPLLTAGVDMFVLISGYFLINLRWRSVARLAITVWVFVALDLLLARWSVGYVPALRQWAYYLLFPFSRSGYWFVAAYFALMLLSPVLNVAVKSLEMKRFRIVILLLTLFQVYSCSLGENFISNRGYDLGNFIYLYLLGSYLRREPAVKAIPLRAWVIVLIVSLLANVALIFPFALQDRAGGEPLAGDNLTCQYSFVTVILTAASLLLLLAGRPMQSRSINSVAGAAFGVYLLQDGQLGHKALYPWLEGLMEQGAVGRWVVGVLTLTVSLWAAAWVVNYVLKLVIPSALDAVAKLLTPFRRSIE